VKVVSDQEVSDCPDLYITQEEVDTRMIPQALHADKRLTVTLVRRSLSADLMEFFTSYRSNTSATVCAFAKHDVNCLQFSVAMSPKVLFFFASMH
jgi:hypothetical protein